MRRFFIFVSLLFSSGLVFACGTDIQRERMAERLHADIDMQKFVCAADSCPISEFEKGLKFYKYKESFRGKVILICVIESALNAKNSYTGIFAAKSGEFEFQFISYGSGIKVGANKAGVPMIMEYGVSDPDGSEYSLNQYLWNGEGFISYQNVPLCN
ncbi:hypothetical protein [Paraburkholderia tagetis]|uniref:Lipoprotein n=1 Tax=Paraburkholderia tagetis TaxID=2913261 RepID=A0A9X1UFX9_9BURK|nr:hypothetical protein [Paraburkholderia tagetis]MCG5071902.1 hypothetical protein [Paraburkholderia tagetis]